MSFSTSVDVSVDLHLMEECFWTSVKSKMRAGGCLLICGYRCFFTSFCVERRELGTCQYFCLYLYVPLTDNEGPSISYKKSSYTHSSVLYSPDFSRCSLETSIKDFMIFRAVRIPLPSPF